jgi:hypothetical protein
VKRFSLGGRAAVLVAATLMSLGATAASAQAATTSGARGGGITHPAATSGATPNFTCPSHTLCIFQDAKWRGTVGEYQTSDWAGAWVSLTTTSSLTLPWKSFHNNSGSSVMFGDYQTGAEECIRPDSKLSDPPEIHYGYIWIEYGNTNCTGNVPQIP